MNHFIVTVIWGFTLIGISFMGISVLAGVIAWTVLDGEMNFKPYRLLRIPFIIGLCYLVGRVFK